MKVLHSKILIIILCLLPLVPLWYFEFLPLQDYPNHFARLQIMREYDHSDFYRENFSIEPFRGISPIPNLTLDIFVNSFLPFLDVDTAMRLFISLYILFYIFSLYLLAKELALDFSLLLLFNMPLIYSFFFHLGLLGFIFSIPLFLFGIYFLQRYERKKNLLYILLFGLFSLFVYITHIISFFVLCVVLFCYLLAKRLTTKDIFYMLLAISPPVILTLNYIFSVTTKDALMKTSLAYKFHLLYSAFWHLPVSLIIINSALFVSAVYLMSRNSLIHRSAYFYAAALIFTAYLLLPFDGISGSYLYGRPFLYSLILLSLSMNAKEGRQFELTRLMLVSVFFISSSWLVISFADFNKNFSTRCAFSIQEKSRLLSVDATKYKEEIRSYWYSWGYFLRHREFLENNLISGIQQQIKYIRKPQKTDKNHDAYSKDKGNNPLAGLIESYDYVLLFGKDPKAEAKLDSISHRVCTDRMTGLYKITK